MDQLSKGEIPWRKRWSSPEDMPRNRVTGKLYRGINVWILDAQGYTSSQWLTFKQVKSLGGQVKKGEKATAIVFWKMIPVDKDINEHEEKEKYISLLKTYHVFNVAQTTLEPEILEPIEPCKANTLISNWSDKPLIKHGFRHATYSRSEDLVMLPNETQFETKSFYWATLFHEAVHATGHDSRLDRAQSTRRGVGKYAFEELIAEMGAGYLCGFCGIEQDTLEDHRSYIQSWLKSLQSDPTWVIKASSKAQRAVDYILGVEYE